MTRFTVFVGVGVLALAFPAPTATHPRASEVSASRLPLAAPDDTPRPVIERSVTAHPDGGRLEPSRDPNIPRVRPRILSHPDGGAHRARLDAAVERFTRAGLLLPDLEVHFSDTGDACRGNLGLFDRNSTPWRVDVCSDLEFVLTHEMAHAWVAANLDDAERAAYAAYRGLPTWHDPDLHWRERGTEDAAFVMQQVLMAKHVRRDSSVWVERIEAFEQLTGRAPPPVVAGPDSDAPDAIHEVAPRPAI